MNKTLEGMDVTKALQRPAVTVACARTLRVTDTYAVPYGVDSALAGRVAYPGPPSTPESEEWVGCVTAS
jgi:hypothetical protein